MIAIDHIFIFSNQGQETDELVDFGLTEGSGRSHQGIGTANRRLFFDNFYLEILWVRDEQEAKSVDKLNIWERSNFLSNTYSRFGLCLKNTAETDMLFKDAIQWKADFLPSDEVVNILTSERMPWIFRFPPRANTKFNEPRTHSNGINKLTKATFYLEHLDFEDQLSKLSKNSNIEFIAAEKEYLVLEFDNGAQGKYQHFESLGLQIDY